MSNAEKLKALKLTIDKIDKDFGKGSVMMMNERGEQTQEVVSTGSIGLDAALGIGGLPRGRVVEIYGPESSGKTTVATHVIAEAQKKGGMCAIIDAEHAFDSAYAQKLGVDIDNLLISQPDYGEQALEIADRLILSGALDVVVIDSVAALVPKGELEGEMGDSKMGLQARLMSQARPKEEQDAPAVTTESPSNAPAETTAAPQEKKKKLRDKIMDIFRKKPDEQKSEEAKPIETDNGERRSTRREDGASLEQMVSVRFTVPNDWMMGVKGAQATLVNRSSETVSKAVVEVLYYDDDNNLLQKKTITFGNVDSKDSKTVSIPDHSTATKVDYKVVSVTGKPGA